MKGCWEDLVPKMRCDASSIITNNPESGKAGGISQRKEKVP
ncbi:hypothetical protein PO124_28600 [Bacillus licheniformis]|nr:hypothetical protein [Bacillus licheniformis]